MNVSIIITEKTTLKEICDKRNAFELLFGKPKIMISGNWETLDNIGFFGRADVVSIGKKYITVRNGKAYFKVKLTPSNTQLEKNTIMFYD